MGFPQQLTGKLSPTTQRRLKCCGLKLGLLSAVLSVSPVSLAQDKDSITDVHAISEPVSVSKDTATALVSATQQPEQNPDKNAAQAEAPDQDLAQFGPPKPDTVQTETPDPHPAQFGPPKPDTAQAEVIPSNPEPDSAASNPIVSLIPADAATANVLAQQRRIDRLTSHIQDRYDISSEKARHIVKAAIRSAEIHQLEPELLLAIIAVESTFNERAVSRVGARGLMQVMPGPHSDKVREIGGRQALFDPVKNIHTGAQILVDYLNRQPGNLRRALLRYNGSLNRPRSAYPDKVMRIYRDFQRATTTEAIASTTVRG